MNKEIIKKWDNISIKVISKLHGANVIKFWQSIGVDTKYYKGTDINHHYGLFNGEFDSFYRVDARTNHKILTLEEAIAIRDKDKKTFPREMYVWNDKIKYAEKRNVVYFGEYKKITYNVMTYSEDGFRTYKKAMEIEEYEAMKKNKYILDEIAETKKQMNSLNDKLIELENKLK